jgi:HK97 family phage major capsid protein/HK97 family phage prohead protease
VSVNGGQPATIWDSALTATDTRRVRRALDGDRTVTATRAFPIDDIRILDRAQGGDGRTVEAYAAVFLRPTEIMDQDGHYLEQIAAAAFNNSLQQRSAKVFCCYNHGKTLGGTPSDRWSVPIGTPVDMRADARGLLTQTRYNTGADAEEILQAILNKSLRGMSFTGVFLRSDPELTGPWAEYGPGRGGELPLVTRHEIALIEYGPTPIPAYDDAEIIAVRAQQQPGRETIRILTPDVLADQQRALSMDSAPRLTPAPGQGPGPVHPDVQAAPVHHSAPLVTPDDPTQAKWDSQQWLNGMTFPADLDHMHSVYALYDTSGKFADGTFARSSGYLPHHLVDNDGRPGPAHPEAVRNALDVLDTLPVTDEAKAGARKHLEGHLHDHETAAASEVDVSHGSQPNATNGSGTGQLASIIPTSSSGRDPEAGSEQERSGGRQDQGEAYRQSLGIDGTMGDAQDIPHPFSRAADGACLGCGLALPAKPHAASAAEYASAVVEITEPADADRLTVFARAVADFQDRAARKFDPDHDGDDDSKASTDTDHDYWTADGKQKKAVPGKPMDGDEGSRGGDAPGDGSKPYGNVEYADPGYQADKKKRYPIDTDEHVTAAWSYINKDSNASKYSAADLAKVKGKIKAEMKKHGHDVSEDGDGGGKKSTSSSGRQPAAQDAAERSEGTDPPADEAAPPGEGHPAPDTSTSRTGSTVMDGPMKIADREARLGEIRERLQVLHALAPDGDLPAEFAAEWTALTEEKTRHDAAVADARSRAAMIASFTTADGAADPAATEGTGNGAGFTGGDGQERSGTQEAARNGANGGTPQFMRKPGRTDRDMAWYDPSLIAARATSAKEVRDKLRDRAMYVLDEGSFPAAGQLRYNRPEDGVFGTLVKEDCQQRIAQLLETIDGRTKFHEGGILARRIIATGNPVYEEAFGQAIEQLSVDGLDPEHRRALALGVDPYGGYAVPYQLDPTIILTSNGAINPLRQLARVETITGKEWDGVTSAGVVVSRALEGTEVGTGDAQLVQPTVRTTRVQGFVPFSIELDVSWGALRSQMTALLMDAKDVEEATSFVTGNGVAPNVNGLVYSVSSSNASVGTASTVYTAGSGALAVADLYSLENAMAPRFRQQSGYLASRTIYNKFRQLFQALASAAFDSWVRPSAGQPATFNGYPAFEVSSMSGTISSGQYALLQGDFKQYLIVDRVGMGIELIPHLFGPTNRYPTGQRGILAIWFNNGQLLVANAFRLLEIQ